MSQDTAITVRNVSKKYTINEEEGRKRRFWRLLKEILGFFDIEKDAASGEFWALRDISFKINRGESLGIVGLNGAGKSTLLKVILGRMKQNKGVIDINGQAGGLVELNAGFHPELDGMRNIYNKGVLLGKSKSEIDSKIEDIVQFADLGDFINSPVKTYSSGMSVRLGFSIVVHFLPEIIICDEILAVGDFDFRQKCFDKIIELKNESSFILVSHSNANILQFCDKALLLHKGEMISIGDPRLVLKHYSFCNAKLNTFEVREKIRKSEEGVSDTVVVKEPTRMEEKVVKLGEDRAMFGYDPKTIETLFGPEYESSEAIQDVEFYLNLVKEEDGFTHFAGEPLVAFLSFTLLRECKNLRIGLPFFDQTGKMIMGPDSRDFEPAWSIKGVGKHEMKIELKTLPVNSGKYWLVMAMKNDPAHIFRRHCGIINIKNHLGYYGEVYVGSNWSKIRKINKSEKKIYRVFQS
jgi:ABC-type polysaccharide/polyol phosphate transport system ATPase subunit